MSVDPLPDDDAAISGLAALDLPLRRQLYQLLVERRDWVGRNEAAAEAGVARSVAAFHLDKLAEAGLAEVTYERPRGRAGPGAGRPAKKYRRSRQETGLTVPPRRYDMAAAILADAVERMGAGVALDEALTEAAHRAGAEIVATWGVEAARPASKLEAMRQLTVILSQLGYEPFDEGGVVFMANCPFHRLVEHHRNLVCGLNLGLIEGLIEAAQLTSTVRAQISPTKRRCCVRIDEQ